MMNQSPVFDPDADDDTDSVIDALERDMEGDVIPADTFIDSLGSDCVNQEVQAIVNGRRQRRLVLVNNASVLDASGDAHQRLWWRDGEHDSIRHDSRGHRSRRSK